MDCSYSTDWSILLQGPNSDIDRMVDCNGLTKCLQRHCCSNKNSALLPEKQNLDHSSIKAVFNMKKQALRDGNRKELRHVRHNLRGALASKG